MQIKSHIKSGNRSIPFLRRAYLHITINRISPQMRNSFCPVTVFVEETIAFKQKLVSSDRIADTGHNSAVLFNCRTVQGQERSNFRRHRAEIGIGFVGHRQIPAAAGTAAVTFSALSGTVIGIRYNTFRFGRRNDVISAVVISAGTSASFAVFAFINRRRTILGPPHIRTAVHAVYDEIAGGLPVVGIGRNKQNRLIGRNNRFRRCLNHDFCRTDNISRHRYLRSRQFIGIDGYGQN